MQLVTLLEEMPVQETLDGIAELKKASLPLGAVIVFIVRAVIPRPSLCWPRAPVPR